MVVPAEVWGVRTGYLQTTERSKADRRKPRSAFMMEKVLQTLMPIVHLRPHGESAI